MTEIESIYTIQKHLLSHLANYRDRLQLQIALGKLSDADKSALAKAVAACLKDQENDTPGN